MRVSHCAALAAVAVIGFASIASAADLPVKAPVYKAPVVAPAYSWTGFYVGVNGGYAFGTDKTYNILEFDGISSFVPASSALPGTYHTDGGLAGGQIGANYQTECSAEL